MSASINKQLLKLKAEGHPLAEKHQHLGYQLTLPCKSNIPSTALTTEQTMDFDIKAHPHLFIKNNKSIYLLVKVQETGGVNSVTPTFAEAFLSKNTAIEYLSNNEPYTHPIPMEQVLLEPALQHSDSEYESLCEGLNHNSAQYYLSVDSLAASGTRSYKIRLPNHLPADGFWMGALENTTWTIRIKTQNAVDSGSGTLAVTSDGFQLLIDCITVPMSMQNELRMHWNHRDWHVTESVLNEPNAVTTVSSGLSPFVKFDAFDGKRIAYILGCLRASRSFTASAYFNIVDPNVEAKIHIEDEDGTQIFTSSSMLYGYNKYILAPAHFGDSRLLKNRGYILFNMTDDIQARFHNGEYDEGAYKFTGDERISISDLGTAASLFFDSIGFYDSRIEIRGGKFGKVQHV